MLKRTAAPLIPVTLLILTFTVLIAATRALAQTQPRGSWLTWVENGEIYLWDGAATHRLTSRRDGDVLTPWWSNDGWLAWVNVFVNDVFVWDGQSIRNVSQSNSVERWALWSPTGQLAWVVVANGEPRLTVWDRFAGIVFSEPYDAFTNIPLWSHDGRLAWTAQPDPNLSSELMVWDGETIINLSNTLYVDECSPTWSNDGQLAWIVGCTNGVNGRVNLLVRDGDSVQSVDRLLFRGFNLRWSSNNRLAWMSNARYLGTMMHDVYVWDGSETVLATGNLGAENASWSPDGSRLAFTSFTPAGHYDLFIWDGKTITPITQDAASERNLVWLDNIRLIYDVLDLTGNPRTSDLFVWNGEIITQLTNTPGPETTLRVSRDGRVTWIVEEFNDIYVWDGQTVFSVQRKNYITELLWSPIIP